ncbi:MAG: hypothetical protein Q9182_004824 [Xanthomendoza sp. 2 TL-2023]
MSRKSSLLVSTASLLTFTTCTCCNPDIHPHSWPKSNTTRVPSDTIVNSAIWLNVEIAIGIVSASLPLMRPLVSRAFPSQLRSRLTNSRNTGSQRLQDPSGKGKLSGSRSGKHPHSKALSDNGIYAGQGRKQPHKSWYNNIAAAKSNKGTMGRGLEEGSEEDMVPMGKIQVRHDVEWEQEPDPGTAKDSGTSVNLR